MKRYILSSSVSDLVQEASTTNNIQRLAQLAESASPNVRKTVAANPNTSVDILYKLADDRSHFAWQIIYNIAQRNDVPVDLMQKIVSEYKYGGDAFLRNDDIDELTLQYIADNARRVDDKRAAKKRLGYAVEPSDDFHYNVSEYAFVHSGDAEFSQTIILATKSLDKAMKTAKRLAKQNQDDLDDLGYVVSTVYQNSDDPFDWVFGEEVWKSWS